MLLRSFSTSNLTEPQGCILNEQLPVATPSVSKQLIHSYRHVDYTLSILLVSFLQIYDSLLPQNIASLQTIYERHSLVIKIENNGQPMSTKNNKRRGYPVKAGLSSQSWAIQSKLSSHNGKKLGAYFFSHLRNNDLHQCIQHTSLFFVASPACLNIYCCPPLSIKIEMNISM